jgi:hypothetical protein
VLAVQLERDDGVTREEAWVDALAQLDRRQDLAAPQ